MLVYVKNSSCLATTLNPSQAPLGGEPAKGLTLGSHRQARSDKGSRKPLGGFVRPQPWRLLFDVGKSRQSAGRVYELRTHGQARWGRHVLLHAEHARSRRGHGGRGQRKADCRHARPLHPRNDPQRQ